MKKKLTCATAALVAFMTSSTTVTASAPKDCLLEGTVVHYEKAGQETTIVKIHSVRKYNKDSNCRVRKGQKLEFKLPHDSRVKAAPSGSEVQYRYQTDEAGRGRSEVIRVGT